jgi:hypothetical protein
MSLADDMIDDLVISFDTNEFAASAILAGGVTIKIIKDFSFIETLGVENVDVGILAKYSDVSALVQNSTITIGGVIYYVMQTPIDDGTGVVSLLLSKNQV